MCGKAILTTVCVCVCVCFFLRDKRADFFLPKRCIFTMFLAHRIKFKRFAFNLFLSTLCIKDEFVRHRE
jgi:hypothetical protein